MGGPPTLDNILIIPRGAEKEYCGKILKLDGTNESIPRKDKMKVALAYVPDNRISCNLSATELR